MYDIAPPPHQGYLYLGGGGQWFKKTFPFSIRYNGKTYGFSSNISYNIEWNSVKCTFFINFDKNTANFLKNYFLDFLYLQLGPV